MCSTPHTQQARPRNSQIWVVLEQLWSQPLPKQGVADDTWHLAAALVLPRQVAPQATHHRHPGLRHVNAVFVVDVSAKLRCMWFPVILSFLNQELSQQLNQLKFLPGQPAGRCAWMSEVNSLQPSKLSTAGHQRYHWQY
jgi:hypothetical protein